MARNNTWIYHLVAFATVAIWGCTFVSTKVLMLNGLSPAQIFTLRFLIAYVMMLAVYHSRLWADSWRDELKMMLLGISGGSLYFLSENEAMNFTSTTNTSLIVCSCPLFATLLVRLVYRSTTRISMMQLGGSLLAFAGMVIVVLNGRFVLHLSPLGDALAFTACLSWSVYSLLMKWVSAKYGAAFITRKVFFYGVLTILPYYIFYPTLPHRCRAHQARGSGQPGIPGLSGVDDLLSHLELVHLQAGRGESHQLGILQPHHHHDFRLVGAGREDYSLLPRRRHLHPVGHVCRRPQHQDQQLTPAFLPSRQPQSPSSPTFSAAKGL